MAADRSAAARWFDGLSAEPTRGVVSVRGDEVQFVPEGGVGRFVPFDERTSVTLLGDEVHVVMVPRTPEDPAPQLVIEDASWEQVVRAVLSSQVGDVPGSRRPRSALAWILVALVVVPMMWLVTRAAGEYGHRLVSVEAEREFGDFVDEQLIDLGQVLEAPKLTAALQGFADRVAAPDSPYELRVSVIDTALPNALALPGGRILVTRGFLELGSPPEAVAAVLAHEVAHVEQRHGLRMMSRSLSVVAFATMAVGGGVDGLELAEALAESASVFVTLTYSRASETEADAAAAARLAQLGHDPADMAVALLDLERALQLEWAEEVPWLLTHPVTNKRVEDLLAAPGPAYVGEEWIAAEEWSAALSELESL